MNLPPEFVLRRSSLDGSSRAWDRIIGDRRVGSLSIEIYPEPGIPLRVTARGDVAREIVEKIAQECAKECRGAVLRYFDELATAAGVPGNDVGIR